VSVDFQVGPWLVKPSLNVISCGGKTVRLEPKVMEVLVCLAGHAGEALPKETLLQTVWADTFVSEDVLKRCISQLRRVFGDDAREPRIIETIPKRGYRLVARVAQITEKNEFPTVAPSVPTSNDVVESQIASLRRRWWLGAVAIAAAVVAMLVIALRGSRSARANGVPPIRSLAVLPLQNLSGDPAQEYFSDGLTDALITDLTQLGSVRVISRTSSMQYKKTRKSLPEIARELNVDGIIEGTVQRFGGRVRITAQLVQGPTDRHLWANGYERDTQNLLALEQEVTEEIVHQISTHITTTKLPERAQPWPMDPNALEAYLQGRFHYNLSGKGFGDEEKRKAAQYFEQAVAADPNFAPAYNWLALAHQNLLLGSSEDVAATRKAAEKAVTIDPNFSDARITLAVVKWQAYLDWRGIEQDFRRNLALNPDSADAHSAMGLLLSVLGHREEGLRESRIAQRLEPYDDDAALGLYFGRDYDGSIAMLRVLLQPDPKVGIWHCNLFPNYAMKGMQKEFIAELAQCFSLYGLSEAAANIQRAFERSGYQAAIRQWAREIERLQTMRKVFLPGQLAMAYSTLGDKDRAFYWLDQAYEHREMVSMDGGIFFLGAEPMYDTLRPDPRFKDLLRRVGLPQ
jgi:TolB-like protein/DNA-binding winged helix-turn-helix (wHTH) protein